MRGVAAPGNDEHEMRERSPAAIRFAFGSSTRGVFVRAAEHPVVHSSSVSCSSRRQGSKVCLTNAISSTSLVRARGDSALKKDVGLANTACAFQFAMSCGTLMSSA